uniref:Uncharacterized protein n=1 Tax=Rhizophagus irregularis (strain DAOM 181602 / DAOM 197198 / MUCL 43194) TaxID=747089 RepID=U9SW60_RHIID
MVRRHSLILESLLEGQGEGTNVKSKVRMTHLWRIYVAATSGVCVEGHIFGVYDLVPSFHLVYHVGLDLVGIADVKNTRDIDDVLSFTDHTLANISRGPMQKEMQQRGFFFSG